MFFYNLITYINLISIAPYYNVCYIKHFLTKSAEEYRNNKMSRLRCDLNIEYYTISVFFKYNTFTEEKYKVLKETKSS